MIYKALSYPYSRAVPAVLLLSACVGCTGGDFPIAPVSGIVTLNGEPLEGAFVRFAPQPQSDDPIVGPTSVAVADSEGRYELRALKGGQGAVVGPHVVSISTYESRPVDPANSDAIEVVSEEKVPARYRSPSELTFEVPSGGTDSANFELTSQ